MVDEYSNVKLGDWVQARKPIYDGEDEAAQVGDVGNVIGKEDGCGPTIRWERTGHVIDCDPDGEDGGEFDVLCEDGFASTEEKTPSRPRRVMIRRGVS